MNCRTAEPEVRAVDTAEALAEMGVEGLTADQAERLDRDGYFIVPEVFTRRGSGAARRVRPVGGRGGQGLR